MKEQRIKEILEQIKNVTVAVYGDFCVDAYWLLDPQGSEISVETGLQCQAVTKHYYSLGGASNVVANLAALEPAAIQVIGVTGDDIFGRELRRQFHGLGVDTTHLVTQEEDFDTVAFAKPYIEGQEQARIDFGFRNQRTHATDESLLASIERALQTVDALIMNQQVPGSITHDAFIDRANDLFAKYSDKVVLLDSRHMGHKFKHIIRKTNDFEAAQLNGVDVDLQDVLMLDDVRQYAQTLYHQFQRPVFLTRGARGIISIDSDGLHEIPGIQFLAKLDPVGAGDTVTSALALCLGANIPTAETAEFANLAAGVTVQKLFCTGTACAEEIMEVGQDTDYIFQPELAEDPRQAQSLPDTDIERCYPTLSTGHVKHVVFDNDGTISTLRQGWEAIMTPMMIKAILGDQYDTADETLYHKVRTRVLDYIDKSTGIQTILQMEALVAMVTEFGIVPPDRVLDKAGYKAIYNRSLCDVVDQRIKKLKKNLLDITDYTVKGAVECLRTLHAQGITLYLASGTDHQDVVAEASALGYADLFNGGIYGALGDVTKYSKKMVIDRIMTENNLQGPELAVFGDGPVEIREVRKRNGLAIGIASDEVQRHGWNPEKRSRLIKAGAHLVCPDFCEYKALLAYLLSEG